MSAYLQRLVARGRHVGSKLRPRARSAFEPWPSAHPTPTVRRVNRQASHGSYAVDAGRGEAATEKTGPHQTARRFPVRETADSGLPSRTTRLPGDIVQQDQTAPKAVPEAEAAPATPQREGATRAAPTAGLPAVRPPIPTEGEDSVPKVSILESSLEESRGHVTSPFVQETSQAEKPVTRAGITPSGPMQTEESGVRTPIRAESPVADQAQSERRRPSSGADEARAPQSALDAPTPHKSGSGTRPVQLVATPEPVLRPVKRPEGPGTPSAPGGRRQLSAQNWGPLESQLEAHRPASEAEFPPSVQVSVEAQRPGAEAPLSVPASAPPPGDSQPATPPGRDAERSPSLTARPRVSSSRPVPVPEPVPTIHVTIGRVEVRAVTPPPPTPRRQAERPAPVISLDEFLKPSGTR